MYIDNQYFYYKSSSRLFNFLYKVQPMLYSVYGQRNFLFMVNGMKKMIRQYN